MRGIQVDNNGNLIVENGSLKIDSNDYQSIRLLFVSQKGEIKENPLLGVGIDNFLKSTKENVEGLFLNEAGKQLELAGYKGAEVIINNSLLDFEVNL